VNIQIYRTCRKERQTKYQAHLGHLSKGQRNVKETMFHLGPIDSASDQGDINLSPGIRSSSSAAPRDAQPAVNASGRLDNRGIVSNDEHEGEHSQSARSSSSAFPKDARQVISARTRGNKHAMASNEDGEAEAEESMRGRAKKLIKRRRVM
jgi:hypothetical protein